MVTQRSMMAMLVGLMVMMFNLSAHAALTASIDRSVIAIDDSFTLTLRVDRAGGVTAPDLSALEQSFHVLGNSQSSRHMISNGKSESWTEWLITLMPKRKGQLTIPALEVDGEFTRPIRLDVQASVPQSTDYPEPVYVESEVDQSTVYVQQQVIFTLRIFQSIQLDDMNISEPAFDNAAMEKLGQNSFQRRINNTPYRVHELRYAIFPQQAGELIIPEQVFTASEAVSRRSVFSLPGQGKPIRKMSKQHQITVQPPAASFNGALWLPAKSLAVTETWSGDTSQLHVGDSITRTITLKADGLLGSQLPPFEFSELAGAKFYPDQGSTDTTATDRGVVSSRTDSAAIIPTRSGVMVLPEVRYSWWNTATQSLQQAIIPASRLTILPALPGSQSSTPLAIDHSPTAATDITGPLQTAETRSVIWAPLAALMGLGWLITAVYLWRILRRRAAESVAAVPAPSATSLTEKQAFKKLSRACASQDHAAIRSALIAWANSYWPSAAVKNLQDIQQCCNSAAMQQQIAELDRTLFSQQPASSVMLGEQLLKEVQQLRTGNKPLHKDAELPPLYSS